MTPPTEPLSDELKELFDREPIPRPSQAAASRVFGRLAAVTAMGGLPDVATEIPLGPTATGTAIGARAIALAATTFVLGGVVGAAVTLATRSPPTPAQVTYVERPSTTGSGSPVIPSPPSERALTPSDLPDAEPRRVIAVASPASSASSATGSSSGTEERELIDDARAKLASGAAADALRQLDEHTRKFPKPRLEEEREALAVQALVNVGRHADARARAELFRKRWPNSVYLPAVDTTLRSIP